MSYFIVLKEYATGNRQFKVLGKYGGRWDDETLSKFLSEIDLRHLRSRWYVINVDNGFWMVYVYNGIPERVRDFTRCLDSYDLKFLGAIRGLVENSLDTLYRCRKCNGVSIHEVCEDCK